MNSDIVLDNDSLTLDAKVVKSTATDLILDNAARRTSREGDRRALVHNEDDGLTINYSRDYPGGVTIEGEVTVTGRRVIRSAPGTHPSDPPTRIETWHKIVLDGGKVLVKAFESLNKKPPTEHTIDVVQELRQLRNDVRDLQTKLAALTGKDK